MASQMGRSTQALWLALQPQALDKQASVDLEFNGCRGKVSNSCKVESSKAFFWIKAE